MNLNNIINKKLLEAQRIFDNNSHDLFKHFVIEDIDCSRLPDPKHVNAKELPQYLLEKIFYKLHKYDENEGSINDYPIVYVFELFEENKTEEVINQFTKAQKEITDRRLPSIKNFNPSSKTLYVGKVEKNIGGRIITHLGYYNQKGNHGLQLSHWAKGFKLNLHINRFHKNFKPYIAAMEVMIAKELHPIIGRH
jgi:hypothetical protein